VGKQFNIPHLYYDDGSPLSLRFPQYRHPVAGKPDDMHKGDAHMAVANELEWLSPDDIARAIRRQIGDYDAVLIAWTWERLGNAGDGCLGAWRLTSNALTEMFIHPWSLVLKGWGTPVPDARQPARTEVPRTFGDMQREDGSVWMWLEDVEGDHSDPWPIDRYA